MLSRRAFTTCAGPRLPCEPISTSHRSGDVLARLLATAATMLETDRLAARTCIQRAAAALGIDLSETGSTLPRNSYLKGGLAPWQAKRVRYYIEDNLASSLPVVDLAHVAQLSTSHFFRAFRETFGAPPRAYIMRRRILRAQQLMLSSGQPISQIALECGMCDQAHFTRAFRKIVGTNPKAWRRQFAANVPSPLAAAPALQVPSENDTRT